MFAYKECMDAVVAESIAAGQVNGANVLFIRNGEEVYFNSQGYADREAGKPMARDTIFRLFSMSKPITAVAILILAERGKLDLWDNISKYIPEFGEVTVADAEGNIKKADREITIWHLLTMTSGIPYPDTDCEAARRMGELFWNIEKELQAGKPTDTLAYCRRIAKIPLCFEPGEKWRYGLSADILGGIVEVVSGVKFGRFLEKEIFKPLKMHDTGFFVPGEKWNRFAVNYEWSEEKKMLVPFLKNHLGLEGYGENVIFESGGAGLVSTIEDYSHFAQMLLNGGSYQGVRILGRKTVELMRSSHLNAEQKETYNWDNLKGYGYGCLVRVLENPGNNGCNGDVGEFGWDGWTGNNMLINTKENMVLLYFIQRCGAGTTGEFRKLRTIAYASLE